ncbi:hypothetical protein [Actinomadura verrucosospora]|uniref:Guanylate cyclase domain-containing protein n=1 Tax=Actinomadura verrucosospora TaxID=46165 RepID=A0A7D3VS52_ACTVE|nr:hypothetical protein [Actinomadura verrucosospora]QKG21698.1 hypothetical protein ACTIVE_3336 [Actinomadura verrucosospora]
MAEGDDFARRLVVSVDAKGYGGSTGNWQARIQAGLLRVLGLAAERAGLDRSGWATQPAGDGELAVLPAGEPEPRVVDDFARHLHAELRRHNRDLPADKRLRLRLAVHFGPAIPAGNGYSGAGPVVASRLCDSPPLRAALDLTGAALAVIVSARVFSETVEQEHTSLDPADFRRVTVRVKEFAEDAWIWVPGHDIDGLDLDSGQAPPPGAGPAPRPADGAAQEPAAGDYAGARIQAGSFIGRDSINITRGGGDGR